ncbi:hypothetical protein DMB66_37185 [Actinoplanes sp. ATCC 53533]|uniref:hypothetical protein n=1 Tax=Actinoplanes sp. ATCC 53533 TaxID=1288362 RepID=UPI000F788218|nr:hypothetical protein [Actinoplanes sp. ATCC 53533]RSM54667.1 hypothetical protein DMB66_37185 [Actinoplanes sp. ATCC 53533]
MRNEVHDNNSVVARRIRRRKQAFIGVAGLAVLGAGSFLVTSQVADNAKTETKDAAALVPVAPVDETPSESAPPAAPSASAVPSASAAPSPSASAKPPVVTPSPSRSHSKAVDERIKAARAAAAADGHPVQRALTPSKAAKTGPVTVKTIGSIYEDGATMRVLSAKFDLTGQREMLWAADDGEPVGDARCTQNFHFSNNRVPGERPTMLLCWRTSAKKSVVTVAVVKEGRPAKPASAAMIEKVWRTL